MRVISYTILSLVILCLCFGLLVQRDLHNKELIKKDMIINGLKHRLNESKRIEDEAVVKEFKSTKEASSCRGINFNINKDLIECKATLKLLK